MTGDVLLRNVTVDDLPVLFRQQLDPDATRMAAFPARDKDAFMAHWTKILADDTLVKKAILFDGEVAGNIVCFEKSGQTLVGYWIGKEHWGKGIATRALAALLECVETRPLYAYVAKHNAASIGVLQKCGFAVCGEGEGSVGESGEAVAEFLMKLGASDR